jgi:hypothetical protein
VFPQYEESQFEFITRTLKKADPYGGFLVLISFWRPDPSAPDPDMPGLKQSTMVYYENVNY